MKRKYPHRTGNVTQAQLANIDRASHKSADLLGGGTGDDDPTWFGIRLEARRNVHAFPVNIAWLDNDVGHVDRHAKHDALIGRPIGRLYGYALLQGECATSRFER